MWVLFLIVMVVAIATILFRAREPREARPPADRAAVSKQEQMAVAHLQSFSAPVQEDGDDLTLIARPPSREVSAQLPNLRYAVEAAPSAHGAEAAELSLLAEVIGEMQEGQQGSSLQAREAKLGGSRALLFREADAADDERTGPVARVLVFAQADSDRGRVRRRNEDSLLVLPEQAVFAVADGMGGYAGGQVASSLAVETMRKVFTVAETPEARADFALPRSGRELALALIEANRAVYEAASNDPALAQMGTTLVAARFAVNKQRLYVGHVGDSRCYRLRSGELRQLTQDHTMAELGLVGPRANDLSRALGMEPEVALDLLIDRPQIGDLYLLCSDGLTKMVSDQAIRDTLMTEEELEAAVYTLIEKANDAGGRDNVTVILVKVLAANATASAGHSAASRPA